MTNKHCNDCGDLVQYNGSDCGDYNIDINDNIICGECGIKSHCFCDYCDEYVPTSECETLEIEDAEETYFEVACSECYNNLYKDNK